MKSLILFLSGILMSSSFAVVTKGCPQKIVIELSDFSMNGVIDDNFEPQDVNDFPFDGHNGLGMIRLRKTLSELGSLTAMVELKWKGNAQCSYRGEDSLGKYVGVTLKGSLRPNAKEPATMVLYRGSLAAYTSLASLKPLSPKWPSTSLYYRGEWCSWGDCIPNHIQIGEANTTILK